MRLILASASPRRQEILRNAGFDFEVRRSSISEDALPGEPPETMVSRLAREKALDVAATAPERSLVLGADTTVVVDGETFAKPADAADAARMLRLLSGRAHSVLTGVCIVETLDRVAASGCERTEVWFRTLSEPEIRDYVASGEPFDKAGAYGIQGRASRFVTRIEGCYFNVMGLPVALVDRLLRTLGGPTE
ncbi:MAG TPA: Maf family protein [Terriglobia bacterium]|jgi:septum formation protein|nr:Maf family protein [Terriglobia bacterium]